MKRLALVLALLALPGVSAAQYRSFCTTSVQTGDTVANTTTDTPLATQYAMEPTGLTPYTSDNEYGRSVHVFATGVISTLAAAQGTITVALKQRATSTYTSLGGTGAITPPANLSNAGWNLEADCVWNKTGNGTGIASCQGEFKIQNASNAAFVQMITLTGTGTTNWTTSLNTSGNVVNALAPSIAWSVASASNTISMQMVCFDRRS